MSTTNKEILFSARDNGVESTMARIKKSAQDLSSDMLREAKASSNSQKDVIRNYEKQIQLIKNRNSIDAEGRKLKARERLDRKLTDPDATSTSKIKAKEEFRSSMSQISKESKLDQIQVRLLKEIAASLKLDMRSEHESESRREDNDIAQRNAARGGGSERGGGGIMRSSQMDVAGYLQGAQQFMGAQNLSQAAVGVGGSLMAMGGTAGKVGKLMSTIGMVGEVVNMSEDARAKLDKASMQVSALSGYGTGRIDKANIGDDAYKMGYTREEFLSNILPQVAQATGSATLNTVDLAKTVMQVQRGTGMDMGTVMNLERIGSRGMDEGRGGSAMDMVTRMLVSHQGTGAFKNAEGKLDFSRLQESMDLFSSTQNTIMMRSGNLTSMNMPLNIASKLESMGGIYKDDQYKWSTIQSMDKGMVSQSSPESTAIKMSILRKAMPDASYSEIMEEMQKGIDSKHLTRGVMDFVGNTGGDENQRSILFSQLMGGSMNWADVNRMTSDENMGKMTDLTKFTGTDINGYQKSIEGRADMSVSHDVSSQIKRTQTMDDLKADPFGNAGEFVDKMTDGFGVAISELGDRMAGWFE